jgi:hypothetical protein
LVKVTVDGAAQEVGSLPYSEAGPIALGSTADGSYYVVYADGSVFTTNSVKPLADLLPSAASRAGFSSGAMLSATKFLFAYSDGGEPPFDGVVVFDKTNPSEYRQIALPFPARDVTALDEGHLAALNADGSQVAVVDLIYGQTIGTSIPLPVNTKWLIGP